MLARSKNSPDITKKVFKHSLFVKVPIPYALQLHICNLDQSRLVTDVLFELFKLVFGCEEVRSPHVQFIDLSWIEY